MSASMEHIEELLTNIEAIANELRYKEPIGGQQITITGLDDLSENLGLIKAGEFRSGTGVPGKGTGFTGIRLGAPGWTYSGTQYSIVGLNADVLQFGMSNTNGKIYAGAGKVVIGSSGIVIGDSATTQTPYIYFDVTGDAGGPSIFHDTTAGLYVWNAATSVGVNTNLVSSFGSTIISAGLGKRVHVRNYAEDELSDSSGDESIALLVSTMSSAVSSPTFDYSAGGYGALRHVVFSPPTYISSGGVSPTTYACALHITSRPTLTDFSTTRNYGLIIGMDGLVGGEWIKTGGLDLASGVGAGDGDLCYSGDLMPYRNSTAYTGYIFVPAHPPFTHADWTADAKAADADGIIDLSTFSDGSGNIPANIKAVAVRLAVKDETPNVLVQLGPDSGHLGAVSARTQVANQTENVSGIVPCDSNGDIYIDFGDEVDECTIQIWGYFL